MHFEFLSRSLFDNCIENELGKHSLPFNHTQFSADDILSIMKIL